MLWTIRMYNTIRDWGTMNIRRSCIPYKDTERKEGIVSKLRPKWA